MVKRRRLTKAQRLQVYEKYGGKCAYCGSHISLDEMQVDHIKPLALGGADDISNFAPACRMCNFYKSTLSIEKFREQLGLLKRNCRHCESNQIKEGLKMKKMQDLTVEKWPKVMLDQSYKAFMDTLDAVEKEMGEHYPAAYKAESFYRRIQPKLDAAREALDEAYALFGADNPQYGGSIVDSLKDFPGISFRINGAPIGLYQMSGDRYWTR